MLLKFVAPGVHVRRIEKNDVRLGEFLEEDLVIDVRENAVAEVPDKAAEWLLKHEKGDWKKASDTEAEEAGLQSQDDGAVADKQEETGVHDTSSDTPSTTRGARSTKSARS